MQQKPLWRIKEVRRAVGVRTVGEDGEITGVSIDTRTLEKGDLFVALKAERDGHEFVKMAEEKGAAAALVSEAQEGVSIPQIVVADTEEALRQMADAQRDWAGHTKRVAVTGSCGKTTTKELLAAALGAHKSVGSYNNHWGVPLTLARLPRDSKFGVFEVGMNHPGEIAPLSKLVKPHVAVVTNVAAVHAGAFDAVENIAVEKLSITEGLVKGGVLVTALEVYEAYPSYFSQKPITYALEGKADVVAESISQNVDSQNIVASVNGEIVSYRLHLLGEHNAMNSLCALAVAKQLGVNLQTAAAALEKVQPVEGRGNTHEVEGIYVVDESFNANPTSMKAALNSFRNRQISGRKIAIVGDMLELGEKSKEYHENLIPELEGLDMVITVGENMRFVHDGLGKQVVKYHYNQANELVLEKFVSQLESGDAVMVKGSKLMFLVHNFVPRLLKELKRQKSENAA